MYVYDNVTITLAHLRDTLGENFCLPDDNLLVISTVCLLKSVISLKITIHSQLKRDLAC